MQGLIFNSLLDDLLLFFYWHEFHFFLGNVLGAYFYFPWCLPWCVIWCCTGAVLGAVLGALLGALLGAFLETIRPDILKGYKSLS